ncbi:MAG: YbaB/EbfC family nucleoid-associated protein, partial [Rhodospirillales bacterium 12-54-5]
MNMGKIFQQVQQMQNKLNDVREKLEKREFEGHSGSGALKLMLTGKSELSSITIDPSLLKSEDKEMLEDLLAAAVNDAVRKI